MVGMTAVRNAIFAGLVALCGCANGVSVADLVPGYEPIHPATLTLHADVDFTESERDTIFYASQVWRAQTGGVARIEVIYDLDFNDLANVASHKRDSTLVRRLGWMLTVLASDAESECDKCVLGWTTAGGIHNPQGEPVDMTFVMDRVGDFPNEFKEVALHEFGHALGLPHVYSPQSIMFPNVSPSRTPCLKLADLRAFCDVNDCGKAEMSPCE